MTGTNGKSTTTRLLAAATGTLGSTAYSAHGSNMAAGITVALARAPRAPYAALEVDEAFLVPVATELQPTVIVLLNLSRESTRGNLLAAITAGWEEGFRNAAARPDVFVANADDPLVVSVVPDDAPVRWVSDGGGWARDTEVCPRCHGPIRRRPGDWECTDCPLRRPAPDWTLTDTGLTGPDRQSSRLDLALPGAWTRSNAAFAIAAAVELGAEVPAAVAAVAAVTDVDGRYRPFSIDGRSVRLVMVKNAASWTAATTVGGTDPVVLAVEPFGLKDTSPLWEADLDALTGRPVVVTGQRAPDAALRLATSGIAHTVVEDPLTAIRSAPPGPVWVIANYTAFLDLKHALDAD